MQKVVSFFLGRNGNVRLKKKKELSLFIKGKVKMIVQLFDNDYYELSPLFSAIKRHKLDCRDNKHLYGVRNH